MGKYAPTFIRDYNAANHSARAWALIESGWDMSPPQPDEVGMDHEAAAMYHLIEAWKSLAAKRERRKIPLPVPDPQQVPERRGAALKPSADRAGHAVAC